MNDKLLPIDVPIDARLAGGTIWVRIIPSMLDEDRLMVGLQMPGSSTVPFCVAEAEALGKALVATADWVRRNGGAS